MSAMCPMDGCKAKQGMCGHDKMMVLMLVFGIFAAGAHWGLHWL